MLGQYRLKSNGAFHYVYKKGTSYPGKSMVLLCAKSQKGLHIGLSVGKNIGNSVTRNRVKRLFRENFGLITDKIDHGFTYVVIARPPIAEMNFFEIGAELRNLLIKAEKLRTE